MENAEAPASKNLKEIPPKPEAEHDDQVSVDNSLVIPVIDMSKLLDQQSPSSHHDDQMARLHSACKDWGFFQLINHGVPEEVIENMKVDTKEFFKLPLEKKAYAKLPNDFEGYKQFVESKEETVDWGERLFLISLPASNRNIRLWPTHPASFRESIDKYSWELQKLAICLLKLMSRNLGVNSETLTNVFEDGRQSMRLGFYPPYVDPNKLVGLAPHSDASGLTLAIQVNDVQGLQIKKNGKWVLVKSIPGAINVKIGDVIEMMSNGEYKSIEHKVVMNSDKPRLSIAHFHNPIVKTMVGPLPDLVKMSGAKYKSIRCEDYFQRVRHSRMLNGKSFVDDMKLEE